MNRNPSAEVEITRKCLSHLSNEIELLEQYILVSNAIHENVGVSPSPTDSGEDQIAALTKQTEALALERERLTVALSAYLSVPRTQATIRGLLKVINGDNARTISQQRERLLELESSIQKKNRTNSFLIRQSIDLYQRIAIELTDQRPGSPTYSSSGELTANNSANFLQTDC